MNIKLSNHDRSVEINVRVQPSDAVTYSGSKLPVENRYHISEWQFARCERLLGGPSFSGWTHMRDSLGRPVVAKC